MGMSLEDYGSVKNWMGRLAPSTQRVQLAYFKNFHSWYRLNGGDFAEFTPDQLIEYQKAAGNGDQFNLLDMIQRYVSQSRGTYNTKNSRYNNVRSFFIHNRAELPRDKNYTIRPTREPVEGTLTAEEIRQAILSSKPNYQAAFTVMFQAALDQEGFTYWNEKPGNLEDLTQQLREAEKLPREEQAIKIDLPGRKRIKNKRSYYTFAGADAIDMLRNWLKQRWSYKPQHNKNGEFLRDEEGNMVWDESRPITCIIHNQYGDPLEKQALRRYWIDRLRNLSIVDPVKRGTRASKTGKGLHEMRDVYRSLWEKSPSSGTVAEFCLGHSIDELGYNKSFRDIDYYKAEYLKAAPYLQIMTGGEPFGRVDKSEVERLRRELKEAKQAVGERDARLNNVEQTLGTLMRALSHPESGPVLWKALRELEEKAPSTSRSQGPA